MKRLSTIMTCLLAMMAASMSAKAQEVTITLFPGWNWISYPKAETQDISTALGDFEPVNGDMLKSQFGNAVYSNGYWRGSVTHFIPGWGYKYYSNRTEMVSFVFGEAAPQLTVTTAEPTEITAISAVSGGSITSNDGSYVFVLEKGICWATHPSPMVMDDFFTENGSGAESFTAEMTDLTPNTVYYVRAYAVTLDGTIYGEELSFATQDAPDTPEGAINGLFSVSETKQVWFSQGNLKYIGSASTPYWKFADNQWEHLGDNGQTSSDQNINRDLFGWGTSGWDCGNTYYTPWSVIYRRSAVIHSPTVISFSDLYGPPGIYNLTDDYSNSDWGWYNAITNGENVDNLWRALTNEEWDYVINNRNTTSGIRFAKAMVNDVNGLLLLPDNWSNTTFQLSYANEGGVPFNSNVISVSQWNTLQDAGAVFLPVTGIRVNNSHSYGWEYYVTVDISEAATKGVYWSSGTSSTSGAFRLSFDNNSCNSSEYGSRGEGCSIRLVQDYNP